MKKHNRSRAALCAALLAFGSWLSGCSVSFGGLQVGGKEELVFSCEDALPAQEGESPRPDHLLQEESRTEPEADPEAQSAAKAEAQGADSDGRVDLNTAGLDELMTLNGIGESRARAIVEYRTQNGPFARIEDIMQVSGIKEGVFSKIQDQIVVH